MGGREERTGRVRVRERERERAEPEQPEGAWHQSPVVASKESKVSYGVFSQRKIKRNEIKEHLKHNDLIPRHHTAYHQRKIRKSQSPC
jgi:hypothetical protein